MCFEEDNFNDVPNRTNLNASTDRELVYSAEERNLCLSCKRKIQVLRKAELRNNSQNNLLVGENVT
jgi:hypothetical protein